MRVRVSVGNERLRTAVWVGEARVGTVESCTFLLWDTRERNLSENEIKEVPALLPTPKPLENARISREALTRLSSVCRDIMGRGFRKRCTF